MSADVLEPENRSFVKVLLQVVAASLEQRRGSSNFVLRPAAEGRVKGDIGQVGEGEGCAEQPSGQKTISLAYGFRPHLPRGRRLRLQDQVLCGVRAALVVEVGADPENARDPERGSGRLVDRQ